MGHTCCMIQLGSLFFICSHHIDLNRVYPDGAAKIAAKRAIYFPATQHSNSEYIWKLCIGEKFQYIPALENPWVCEVLQGHFRAKLDSDSTSISSCPTSPISSCVGWIDSEARPADSRRSEKEERKRESECVQAWRISGSWLRQLIKSHPAFSLLLMRGAPDPTTAQTRCWRKGNISLLFKQQWEENNECALVYKAEPLLRWSVWWVCNYLMDWAGID